MPSSAPPPGVYVPAILFMHENEEIDYEAQKSHILRLANGGVTGILVQGSNGEAQHLSHAERSAAIAFTRRTLDEHGFRNVLVIAGTGAQSTRETVELCQEAKEAGAAFALVLTPSTWAPKMSKDLVLTFHRTVADKSPIPVMIYNFPVVTAGQNLTSFIIADLAKHPNIVGTKLSCGDIGKLTRLTSAYPPGGPDGDFATFPGKSDVFLSGLLMGSAGVIGASVNLAPKLHTKLYRLFKEGNMEEAREIQNLLSHADAAVGVVGGIGGLKRCVNVYFGYGQEFVRGPLKAVDLVTVNSGEEGEWIKKCVEMEKATTV